jgi:hypothetical protein
VLVYILTVCLVVPYHSQGTVGIVSRVRLEEGFLGKTYVSNTKHRSSIGRQNHYEECEKLYI